jgi:hypothetical protein
MKFLPEQDYREKMANIKRLALNMRARKRPFEVKPLTDAERARIEDVTRFEQFRGNVLKQLGKRPRELR